MLGNFFMFLIIQIFLSLLRTDELKHKNIAVKFGCISEAGVLPGLCVFNYCINKFGDSKCMHSIHNI